MIKILDSKKNNFSSLLDNLLLKRKNKIKFKNEKAVIFSAYNTLSRDIIKHDIEKDPNVFCELINGDTPPDERQPIIDRWGDFEGPAFIVANPDAAGEGLNMVQGNHVIHYTLEWNPAKQEQATKRVHRIGQEKPVFVHRLYYVDTVEEIQIDVLEGRLETASAVIRESILDQFKTKEEVGTFLTRFEKNSEFKLKEVFKNCIEIEK